jgi:predicted 3-demethylubiquinone-9 3-methyltransferase (glyoxalase superfamily)
MVTGCRQAFIIEVFDDSTCNTCPHIPDKLHYAFAGPLGIQDFDIQSHPIKKIDDGKSFPSHKRGVSIIVEIDREDYPTFRIGTLIAG